MTNKPNKPKKTAEPHLPHTELRRNETPAPDIHPAAEKADPSKVDGTESPAPGAAVDRKGRDAQERETQHDRDLDDLFNDLPV